MEIKKASESILQPQFKAEKLPLRKEEEKPQIIEDKVTLKGTCSPRMRTKIADMRAEAARLKGTGLFLWGATSMGVFLLAAVGTPLLAGFALLLAGGGATISYAAGKGSEDEAQALQEKYHC